eukprot:CAMPEP_0171265638 /NCGR_PEP_ID=MMETSP0790-20130122/58226_1 /TAXON_ID=2925 /ORGANISM="Alexandrium catenella, Strain OF101" /LENGTH=291 /DNA_ID=CAMNT_0011734309 /DNA_START=48 /DNA_END=923 /DNA_ORIENTATION=+
MPSNVLTVKIKSAKNLADKDGVFSGHSDPYVRLRLVADDDHTQVVASKRTKVLSGANPEWNETFKFAGLEEPGAYTLKLNVLDKDYFTKDDPLGETTIDLGTLSDSGGFQAFDDVWIDGYIFKAYLSFEVSTAGGWGHSEDTASNLLRVVVKNATGLRDRDGFFGGKSDPYVQVTVTDSSGSVVAGPKKTTVQQDVGANPEWNEEFLFDEGLKHPGAYRLKLTVYDKDTATRDDFLGEAVFHLGTLKNSVDDKELDLSLTKGGRIFVAVSNMGGWGHTKPKGGFAGFCQCS